MLYVLAIGDVRGFAFTLGLTTIIDVVVVFLFTKPMVTPARRAPGSSAAATGCPASTPSTSAARSPTRAAAGSGRRRPKPATRRARRGRRPRVTIAERRAERERAGRREGDAPPGAGDRA